MDLLTRNTTVQQIDLICRTCLNWSNNMKSIFKNDDGDDICSMLQTCLTSGFTIHALDGFPSNICSDCLNKLHISYEFRQQCNISHNTFIHWMATNINGALDSKLEHGPLSETTSTLTKLVNFELYKCRLCPNQYTMLGELQEHFLSDHPYATNFKALEEIINGNDSELSKKDSGLNANNLLMDCVEEKYKIPEPGLFELNSKEHIHRNTENQTTILEDGFEEKYMICEPDVPNIYKRKAQYEQDDDDYHPSVESVNESDSSLEPNYDEEYDKRDVIESTNEDENYDGQVNSLVPIKKKSSPKIEICEKCHKEFTPPRNLLIDMRIKLGPFTKWATICTRCNLSFNAKHSVLELLLRHQFTHLDVKPYPCGLCDKRFSHAANRYEHMQTHAEIFKCDKCDKHFTRKYDLERHYINTHGKKQEKQYICPICGKICRRKDQLRVHTIRMHTKELPHKCPQCGKGFCIVSDRNRHVRVRHIVKHTSVDKKGVENFCTWFVAKLKHFS